MPARDPIERPTQLPVPIHVEGLRTRGRFRDWNPIRDRLPSQAIFIPSFTGNWLVPFILYEGVAHILWSRDRRVITGVILIEHGSSGPPTVQDSTWVVWPLIVNNLRLAIVLIGSLCMPIRQERDPRTDGPALDEVRRTESETGAHVHPNPSPTIFDPMVRGHSIPNIDLNGRVTAPPASVHLHDEFFFRRLRLQSQKLPLALVDRVVIPAVRALRTCSC